MRYFKESESGVAKVCATVEKYAEKREKVKAVKIAKNLIKMGMSNEDIATATRLTEEEIDELRH